MSICYIVGAGDCAELDFVKQNADFVIAADGGYKHLEKNGIKPDAVIGDFDSLGFSPEGDNVIKLNPIKDITDMKAAVDYGADRGYKEFCIYGACGGRIDHTFANFQLAAYLVKKEYRVKIFDGNTVITAISNGAVEFDARMKGYISVFSHTDISDGVTIEGLKYELNYAKLSNTEALGVSNEFIGKKSRVSVKNGILMIVYFNTTS